MSADVLIELTPGGLLVGPPLSSTLLNSGFGTPRGTSVELGEVEAVYLILRGRIEVGNPEEIVKALSSRKRGFWTVYAVFADLSNQGKKLFYDDEKGIILQREGEKMVYIPLSLDKPMTLKTMLAKASTYVEMNWTPVLAIVDEHGTPTYYSLDTRPPSKESLTLEEGNA
ncbi:MAG: hypothetical protein QXH56_03765 [Thermoprotei archaeon]